jgi:hypothetical protein
MKPARRSVTPLPASKMTTRVVAVEILPSAHKHGISDDDIRHAFENAVASITVPDQPDFSMIIGPDETGRLLEIDVVADDDNDYVIHAMPARPKYLKLIRPHRGDQP